MEDPDVDSRDVEELEQNDIGVQERMEVEVRELESAATRVQEPQVQDAQVEKASYRSEMDAWFKRYMEGLLDEQFAEPSSRTKPSAAEPTVTEPSAAATHVEPPIVEDLNNFYDEDYPLEEGDEDLTQGVQNAKTGNPKRRPIGSGANLRPIGMDSQMNFEVLDNESEYEDENMLHTDCDSDDDNQPRYPEINMTDMDNPQFELGMLFNDGDQFKEAVKNHGIANRWEVRFDPNEPKRVHAKCKNKNCGWRIWASKKEPKDDSNPTFQIKAGNFEHACGRVNKHHHLTQHWIAKHYLEDFRSDPDYKVQALVDRVSREKSLTVSLMKVYRAKAIALKLINGDERSQYDNIFRYRAEILRTNPGSTVRGRYKGGRFQGIYMCLAALKNAFKAGCRPFICLDGCFLKGTYKGQLLSAEGIDPNDCMFPIAFGMVETESNETWSWFLELLAEDLEINNSSQWTFMSDRQKGLIGAVEKLFPDASHRLCIRHMYTNFRQKFKGKHLKDLLWNAARAPYEARLKKWLDKIEEISVEAREWLRERPSEHWSRASFTETAQCDILLNNMCESFNNYILDATDKGMITMFELLRIKLMRRIKSKSDWSRGYKFKWCPKIIKRLEIANKLAGRYTTVFNGTDRVQVSGGGEQFIVDLAAKRCECRRWQLCRIPCHHAIAAIIAKNETPENYLDEIYSLDTYKKVYIFFIEPLNGHDLWPEVQGHPPVVPPSPVKRKRGRQKRARRKEPEEIELAGGRGKQLSRKNNVTLTCGNCKRARHNIRTCKANPPENAIAPQTRNAPQTVRWMMDGSSQSTTYSNAEQMNIAQCSVNVNQSTSGRGQATRGRGQGTTGRGQGTRGSASTTRGRGQSTTGRGQGTNGSVSATRGMRRGNMGQRQQ